ncbi:MAG: hypothetical protein AB1782_16375 [Cyanobacteriota bacterium]
MKVERIIKNNTIKRYFAILLTLVTLFIGVIGFNNVFICFGTDNHISIEFDSIDSCCKQNNNILNDSLSKNISSVYSQFRLNILNQCDKCIDIKFIANNLEQSDKIINPIIKFSVLKPVDFSFSIINLLQIRSTKITIKQDNNTNKTLDLLNTVILII